MKQACFYNTPKQMKIVKYIPAMFLNCVLCTAGYAQETTGKKECFTFEASYVGDNVMNFSGGIKTGYRYLGKASILVGFDVENAGLWEGGQFFLNAVSTHGSRPSHELLGDLQTASNIEAGEHTYVQELWFKQALGNFEFTIGLQDLNVEFVNTENGSLYLNSSFGIMPIISNNVETPIFPLTALGFTVKWNISNDFTFLNSFYDGKPTDFKQNPYNIKWEINSEDGILVISELHYKNVIIDLPGKYKAGAYAYSHYAASHELPDQYIYGIYALADQKIWEKGIKNIGTFAQIGYSPSDASINDFHIGFGVNYSGLFSKKGSDILGLGMSYEHFNADVDSETAIEMTYLYQISKNFLLQPDIQYIINPAGTGERLDNCLAGILRFGLSF